MKYVVSLLLGLVVGAAIFAVGLYYNPLTKQQSLSPLSVTDHPVLRLQYSAVASDSLLYTNNGESQIKPVPAKVLQLWEPAIRRSSILVTPLADGRGQLAGIGIKIASDSDDTRLLDGQAMVNSLWHVYLPGRGSLFVNQTENYWDYVRDIVIPAYWSTGDNWRGTWVGNTTAGPESLGSARATGGSGEFAAFSSLAVESYSARAYSVSEGPVSMSGELAIELPLPDELIE